MKKFGKAAAIVLVLALAMMIMGLGQVSFAEEQQIITMGAESFMEDEPITFTINFPEDHELNQADWVGIYNSGVDELNIYDGAGLGIWCYVGTGVRDYGIPESRTVEMEITDMNSTSGNWPLTPGTYKVLLFYNDSYTVAASCPFTIYEYTPATTEPTSEPTNEPTAEPTNEPTTAPEDEDLDVGTSDKSSGCGSVVTSTAAVVAITLSAVAFAVRKKREE